MWLSDGRGCLLCVLLLLCLLLIYGRVLSLLGAWVHAGWRPGSVLPNPSVSRLLDCSPSFPFTGGPSGFSSRSILISGSKATVKFSAVFGKPPASSSCASNCSWSLLHSTPCCTIMYEAVVFRVLWGPPSTSPAPLHLCEAVPVPSIAVTVTHTPTRKQKIIIQMYFKETRVSYYYYEFVKAEANLWNWVDFIFASIIWRCFWVSVRFGRMFAALNCSSLQIVCPSLIVFSPQ